MALFNCKCPKCHKLSPIDPNGFCQNRLRSEAICGYNFPFKYEIANRKFRSKWDKHTSPPTEQSAGTWSWIDERKNYTLYYSSVRSEGTTLLNPRDNYLLLFHTPEGASPTANIVYGSAGTVSQVNGVILPLNAPIQNLHPHFGNLDKDWVHIAAGHDLIVQEPNDSHPETYEVIQNENVVFSFDPLKRTWTSGTANIEQ